jgi:hypothetical protein
MRGTLAACLRFRRPRGRGRRSALLNVGPRLAAPVAAHATTAADAAQFVPPVLSSSFVGGARLLLLFSEYHDTERERDIACLE